MLIQWRKVTIGLFVEVKRWREMTREDKALQETNEENEEELFFWDLESPVAEGEGGLWGAVAIGGVMPKPWEGRKRARAASTLTSSLLPIGQSPMGAGGQVDHGEAFCRGWPSRRQDRLRKYGGQLGGCCDLPTLNMLFLSLVEVENVPYHRVEALWLHQYPPYWQQATRTEL